MYKWSSPSQVKWIHWWKLTPKQQKGLICATALRIWSNILKRSKSFPKLKIPKQEKCVKRASKYQKYWIMVYSNWKDQSWIRCLNGDHPGWRNRNIGLNFKIHMFPFCWRIHIRPHFGNTMRFNNQRIELPMTLLS